MDENQIGREIVDSALKVHRALGPGLLESAYERVLAYELGKRDLQVQRQAAIAVRYETLCVDDAFRIDLWVNQKVVVELKSVEKLLPVHRKQVLTYLRLTGCRLGFLINFGTVLLKDGIERIVDRLPE